jgi:hypothetical protein
MANRTLIIKKLMKSDLSWFAAYRNQEINRAKQFGLNIDTKFIKKLFPDLISETSINVELCYWHSESKSPLKENCQIRHQGKNWRLTGKIEGNTYSILQPGDYILLFFKIENKKVSVYWELAYKSQKNQDLFNHIDNNFITNYIVENIEEENKIINYLDEINQLICLELKRSNEIEQQVNRTLSSRHILADIMSTVVKLSSKTQIQYIEILKGIVEQFRLLLKDQIKTIDLNHKETWNQVKGKKIGFIDGGVASISSIGSEPIAIRVGEYTVRPGTIGEGRETYNFKAQLVDELYSEDEGVFDDFSDDFSKLLDIARIFTETVAVTKSTEEDNKCDMLFLHGPLVNPAAPYADYPKFSEKILGKFGLNPTKIYNIVSPPNEEDSTHFIAVYYFLLKSIFNCDIPICGVVERNTGSRIFSKTILKQLSDKGFANDADYILNTMKDNKISDAILFSCLLKEGEYISPIKIDKNEIGKSPDKWKSVIKNYPEPLTTYLKVTDTSYPFRIEINKDNGDVHNTISFIYHMARLLPTYAFPVGLDIVDKFAKVPAWMSKQISREQSTQILNAAIASGRTDVIDLVRLYLTGNSRDWLFRPKFDQ